MKATASRNSPAMSTVLSSRQARAVLTDFQGPNGLAFIRPDEKLLYVADTGRMHSEDPCYIRVSEVDDCRHLTGGVFSM